LGEVLVESGVADMMVSVFNFPMATDQAQQIFGSGTIWGQAGGSEGVIIPDRDNQLFCLRRGSGPSPAGYAGHRQ
jgi:hypothetical protein